MAKYFITGHTGFKGSWMTLLLKEMGHEVYGYSLPPKNSSLFALSQEDFLGCLSGHQIGDISDREKLQETINSVNPDKIVHLAAQPLVINSYEDPHGNIESNLIGTKNLLDSVMSISPEIPLLVATTDKVYKNDGRDSGYKEFDSLLGGDPYSLSKSLADLTTQYYMNYLGLTNTHIARAGNVIGGGDVSENRLLPELITNNLSGRPVTLRNPNSTRPWQYVLDCIQAYLAILDTPIGHTSERIWNIGPRSNNNVTVRQLADMVQMEIGNTSQQIAEASSKFEWKESKLLSLDSDKFREAYNWHDRFSLELAIRSTVKWYSQVHAGGNAFLVSQNQLREFLSTQ